jgi:hypothetical protein
MMFWINPHFDGDALFHLGQIRKLAVNSPISPNEAFFPIDKISPAYGYNVWYFAIALISSITKLDVTTVWSHLIFILVPTSILSLFAFAFGLFKDRLLALISSIIYVFILGYVGSAWEFRLMPYPDQIARHIVLFISLYFFIQFIREGRRVYFLFTVLTAVLLTTIHLFSWVHFLLAVGFFGLVSFFLKNRRYFFDSSKTLLAVLFLSAPYLYLKLQNARAVVEENYLRKAALNLFDGIYIVNPLSKNLLFYSSVLALIFLIFFYRKSLKNKLWLVFLSSSALASFFVMFNPLVTPFVAKLITFTFTKRLVSLVYIALLFSAFLVFVMLEFKEKVGKEKIFKNLIIVFTFTLIVLLPLNFRSSYSEDKYQERVVPTLEYINNNLPEQVTLAADMWTSYRIPAYTNNFILMTYPNHTTWNVHKPSRLKDLKDIFSSDTSIRDTMALLDKYEVSYLIINEKPKKNDIRVDQDKFAGKKDFKEIYKDNNYKIYSYNLDKKD